MPESSTRIVLYGKGNTLATKNIHKSILKQISPTEVPREFIDNILIVCSGGEKVTFVVKDTIGNFTIEEVKEFLQQHKVKDKVERVEITLDLDIISTKLSQATDSFLEKYFNN